MDTDPNAYFDRGSSSFAQQRPTTAGHRPNASQDTDPRAAAAHPSPKLGGGGPMLAAQRAPPSPKLAPSAALAPTTPHAETSQAAGRRAVAAAAAAAGAAGASVPPLESDMFTPFVSPAPAPSPSRAPVAVVPPASSEQLRHMMDQSQSTICADSSSMATLTANAPAPCPPVTVTPAPEPSSLLTCKPLDRVASAQGTIPTPSSSSSHNATASSSSCSPTTTPVITIPSTRARKSTRRKQDWSRHADKGPMERIVSQAPYYMPPTYLPVKLKRARAMSDPPECYRTNAMNAHRQAKLYRAAGPRKKMRMLSSQEAAQQAADERLMHQIRGRARDNSDHCSRVPPVNMATLRTLDTSEVLRLPQMRHDLLFDNFGFRPVLRHDNRECTSQTHYGLLTTHRSQIVNPSLPTDDINRYWDSIRAEVECGCRCTRWSPEGRIKECICERWKRDLSEALWWRESRATWPSRLPKLIQTLREILESLMASTTPCVNHYAHSMTRESMALHNQTCPTVTHSLVPTLFAALDADFLTIQVRRGNFDTDIFRVIGEAMKVHCAPVRDALVDDMVATALGTNGRLPDVVQALRKCFDCVEVMKLDIANHQVQSLKGMLWQQAEQNEMTTFINYLVAANRTLETSKTYAWINAASKRVAVATPPRERRHLMGQCGCASPTEFVVRSLANGFIDLVFGNWAEASESWPPVVSSRRPRSTAALHVFPTKVVVPEVFKMDSSRIKNFNAEMIDIAIAQAILANFKERFEMQNPNATPDEVALQVAGVRDCYKHVMTLGKGLTHSNEYAPSELAQQMANRIISATVVEEGDASVWELVPGLAVDFDRMIACEISRPDGAAYHNSLTSLRKLVEIMLTNTLLVHRVQPESFLYDMRGIDRKPCTRGEPIPTAARLRVPARRFVTLVEPLTGQGVATSDPRERYHRPADTATVIAARELFHSTIAEAHAAESALAVELGFEPLIHEIRAVVDRMVKTADFNLCVFANLYGKKGMLVGTGQLMPLPELSQN